MEQSKLGRSGIILQNLRALDKVHLQCILDGRLARCVAQKSLGVAMQQELKDLGAVRHCRPQQRRRKAVILHNVFFTMIYIPLQTQSNLRINIALAAVDQLRRQRQKSLQ